MSIIFSIKKLFLTYKAIGLLGTFKKIIFFFKRQGGLSYQPIKIADSMCFNDENAAHFGYVSHDPLVSVIAVNFNGAEDLPDFLESLTKQSYRKFELIIVDNDSKDNSEEIVNKYKLSFPGEVIFVKAGKNLGFAEGNNVALEYAKGEFLALLNIDTRTHEDWLRELIESIRGDADAAVIAPKILFWSRFHDLEIKSDQKVILDLIALERSLLYKKFFIRGGIVNEGNLVSDDDMRIIISIPVQEEAIDIILSILSRPAKNVEIKTPTKTICRTSITKQVNININFSIDSVGHANFIINNAGSTADSKGMPCDRGFSEYDQGQYDNKCYLTYFCGCSALIRRAAIINRPIFVAEFFAYYEDSELSKWINLSGFKILYAPRSIVFHKHSATTSEGSPTWRYLVERSRLIFNHTRTGVDLMRSLTALKETYQDIVNRDLMNILADYDKSIINRLNTGEQLGISRKAIGIYNSYWNSYGGGESHALSIASELQQFAPVYLISETDFDIDALSKYFSIDLSRCRKLVLPKIDVRLTDRFYIFINSTFCSNLPSRAIYSLYLVSFPHRHASKAMIESYSFLFNSPYTESWAKKIWGIDISGEIIYPVRMIGSCIDRKNYFSVNKKKKIILSVGRFNPFGHSKNQLEIAKAYRSLVARMLDKNQWKLILAGSLDYDQPDHVAYYDSVKSCLNGLNVELIPNIDKDSLNLLYLEATIYVHATGMGYNKITEPECFEHFGITPLEAMQSGCIPVVFDTGGPADLIRDLDIGYTYSSAESLQFTLKKLIATDFDTLINECRTVHERGSNFVDVESSRPILIDPCIEYFKNCAT
jgi:GT2 family glycosyltransferase